MFEREVSDILIATLAAFVVYMIALSQTESFLITLQTVFCMLLIFANFLHMILRQLRRLDTRGSQLFSYFNAILVILCAVVFLVSSPEPADGFWSGIQNGFELSILLSFAIQVLLAIDGLSVE